MTAASEPSAFRDAQPIAWTYHRATARWAFNVEIADSPPSFPGRENPAAAWTALPAAQLPMIPLGDAITARLSCRMFRRDPVSLAGLAAVLHGCYGKLGNSIEGDTKYPD